VLWVKYVIRWFGVLIYCVYRLRGVVVKFIYQKDKISRHTKPLLFMTNEL
jgi:hypothetical protein